MKTIPQRFYWKKWGSFAGLLLLSFIPLLSISYIFAIPLLPAGLFHAGVCALGSFFALMGRSSTSNQSERRDINLSCKQEREMYATLENLAKKANSPTPLLKVETVKKGQRLGAYSKGFPHTPTIIVTEGFFQINQKHLTQDTIETLLAHELTHITKRDSLLALIHGVLEKAITIHLLISLVSVAAILGGAFLSMPIAPLSASLIFSPLLLSGVFLCFSFLKRIFDQSVEYIADLGAVQLTQNPRAAALFISEGRFHELAWGNVIVEKNHDEIFFKKKSAVTYYKKWCSEAEKTPNRRAEHYRMYMKKISEQMYDNARKDFEVAPRLFPSGHPSMKSRRKAIKDTYPEAFVKSKPAIK